MDKFNKVIANNPKVAMIQISLDQNKSAAEGWAVQDKLPWYTILPEDVKKGGFNEAFKSTQYVPEYALVDADGKRLSSEEKVFETIAKLSE